MIDDSKSFDISFSHGMTVDTLEQLSCGYLFAQFFTEINLWNPDTGNLMVTFSKTFRHNCVFKSFAISEDKKYLAFGKGLQLFLFYIFY